MSTNHFSHGRGGNDLSIDGQVETCPGPTKRKATNILQYFSKRQTTSSTVTESQSNNVVAPTCDDKQSDDRPHIVSRACIDSDELSEDDKKHDDSRPAILNTVSEREPSPPQSSKQASSSTDPLIHETDMSCSPQPRIREIREPCLCGRWTKRGAHVWPAPKPKGAEKWGKGERGIWSKANHTLLVVRHHERDFSWVKFCALCHELYCTICRQANGSNQHQSKSTRDKWRIGIPDGHGWQRSDLRKHEDTTAHQLAVKHIDSLKETKFQTLPTAVRTQSDARVAHSSTSLLPDCIIINIIHCLALNDIAQAKTSAVAHLISETISLITETYANDSPEHAKFLRMIHTKAAPQFLSHDHGAEIVGWAGHMKTRNVIHAIASQCKLKAFPPLILSSVVSLSFDCSSDKSNIEKMVIEVRHLNIDRTRAVTTFASIARVSDTTASGECRVILQELKKLSLQGSVIAAAADGAAVNWGERNGVLAKLKLRDDSVWCMAHQIALTVPRLKKIHSHFADMLALLSGIATDFWASSKATTQWEVLHEAHHLTLLRPISTNKVRWLLVFESCVRTVERHLLFYEHYNNANTAKAHGRVNALTDLHILHILYLAVDVLKPLMDFNRTYQGEDQLICEVQKNCSRLQQRLIVARDTVGEKEAMFFNRVQLDEPLTFKLSDSVVFKLRFRGTIENAIKRMKLDRQTFFSKCISDAAAAAPASDSVISAMSVWDLTLIPSSIEGINAHLERANAKLAVIYKHFKNKSRIIKPHGTEEYITQTAVNMWHEFTDKYRLPPPSLALLQSQYRLMIPDLIAQGRSVRSARLISRPQQPGSIYADDYEAKSSVPSTEKYSQATAFEMIILNNATACPLACECIRWMLVYPTNSAGCERRFSLMNRVKTKSRLRLSHVTLSDIMHIRANSILSADLDHRQIMVSLPGVQLSSEC